MRTQIANRCAPSNSFAAIYTIVCNPLATTETFVVMKLAMAQCSIDSSQASVHALLSLHLLVHHVALMVR
jgi:hypothetical protein